MESFLEGGGGGEGYGSYKTLSPVSGCGVHGLCIDLGPWIHAPRRRQWTSSGYPGLVGEVEGGLSGIFI